MPNTIYSCMPNTNSCMPNIKSIFNLHNHKILRSNNTNKTCNCRDKISYPFNGECLYKGVYKATIVCNHTEMKLNYTMAPLWYLLIIIIIGPMSTGIGYACLPEYQR